MLLCRVYPEMGTKDRGTWHTDNSLFGKAGDDMEKIALFLALNLPITSRAEQS